jgi:hypothetical protein
MCNYLLLSIRSSGGTCSTACLPSTRSLQKRPPRREKCLYFRPLRPWTRLLKLPSPRTANVNMKTNYSVKSILSTNLAVLIEIFYLNFSKIFKRAWYNSRGSLDSSNNFKSYLVIGNLSMSQTNCCYASHR